MDDHSTRKAVRMGDLVVDLGARTVQRDGRIIELPKTSFDFLAALIETSPDVLSTGELMDRVWKGRVVSPATIAKRVEMLRQSLGDDASDPRYIALVRGHGYRLLPEPRPMRRIPAQAARTAWPVAAVVLACIVLISVFLLRGEDRPPSHSIAVLPFSNLGSQEETGHLSDGLATELTSLLTTIPDFKVAARTSAFAFKGRSEDVKTIGEQLGVGHILTGSVQLSGERLRVSAQLIDTDDGYHVWSNSWERRMTDIFEIQDEITSAVVRSLKLRLLDEIPASPRVDPDAYFYYLKSREAYYEDNEPNTGTDTDTVNALALELATQALAIDPEFAAAWALLARIQFNQAQWASDVRSEGFRSAASAAKRALEIDPGEHRALTILGNVEDLWHWNSESAASFYRRALDISPGDLGALNGVSVLLDRFELSETMNYTLLAYERDPLNKTTAINLALAYWSQGQHEQAWEQLERARALAPNSLRIQSIGAMFSYLQGDFLTAAEQSEGVNKTTRACALERMNRSAESLGLLEEITALDTPGSLAVAEIHACRGDVSQAFKWLERGVASHDPIMRWLRARPLLEPLHDDPRWDALLDEIGINEADAIRARSILEGALP